MTDLTAVTMPKWGLAMEEGTVTAWLSAVGDDVAPGADLLEVETSKIANVIEAPTAGMLLRVIAAAGTILPVGALLGVIGPADAPASLVDDFVAARQAMAAEAGEVAESSGPRQVVVGSRSITYIEVGESAGEALPLLLIHGFGGDRNNWLFNLETLSQTRRVVALDLPGHGASSKDVGDGSLATLAEVVAGFIDALGLARVVLAGHSMGGGVALTLALDKPAKVAGVVALGSMGLGSNVDGAFVQNLLAADRRKEMKPALEMLFAETALVSSDMVEAMLAFKRIDGVQVALDSLAQSALTDASNTALAARAAGLKVPLLALHGAADRIIPLPAGVEPIGDAGHMVHMEAAAVVNARIAAFAKGLDQVGPGDPRR